MACRFIVNSAFEARPLIRLSHQRTVLFGTVNKLGCPIPGRPALPLILSSRPYSESTPTPPFPKTSGSSEGSESSGPKDENWFSRKGWDELWSKIWSGTLAGGVATLGIGIATYATQSIWGDWYQDFRKSIHESARESAIYDRLKKGPVFGDDINFIIPRNTLVENIKKRITPTEKGRHYPLIVGEHGTGKTSLIELAVNSMNEPKGVVYVDIPIECDVAADIVQAIQDALDWRPDQLIDSSEPMSLGGILRVFSHLATKYKKEYKTVPVLIIDNANRLALKQQGLLDLFQDYAKLASDKKMATVVFVSSEGCVPRRMMDRSAWSRHGKIIEIGDVSKEEALQYLKLRKIDEEQATQIYELTGGCIIHLESIADYIQEMGTFEAAREEMFVDVQNQLSSAEIDSGHPYHKEGATIIRELLEKGSISKRTYYDLVGIDIGNKLLDTNVFAVHVNSGEITFQSTMMKRFCEENSALWSSAASASNVGN